MTDREIMQQALEALDYEAEKSNDFGAWLDIRKALSERLAQQEHIQALEDAVAAEREKVAAWMIQRGYATGHGDITEDLLVELEWQVRESEREHCAEICDHVAANAVLGTAGECARAIRGQ